MDTVDIRPPALAGQWYAADPHTLRRNVSGFLGGAGDIPTGRIILAVIPHAGYAWSGAVAGRVLGLLRESRYERIVVLAPNHRLALQKIATPAAEAFATPLGNVRVDREAIETLEKSGAARSTPAAHRHEHAIEIQLPLLQALWPSPPPIVPLLVPDLSPDTRATAIESLAPWCTGASLFIVSTDFTHFGSDFGYRPFADDIPRRLKNLDMGAISRIQAWDADGLRDYGRTTGITMCGLEAMALVMNLPWPHHPEISLIHYARSGDRSQDYSVSVSYAGLIGIWPQEESA